jgi:mono/diheme cytochrome c family protein
VSVGRIVPVLLALILAGLIGMHALIERDPDRRNYEFMPNMIESVARDAQSPPLVLPDGTAVDMRTPHGSVARGHIPLDFEATPEGALLAGNTLKNPIGEDNAEAITRGAFVFGTFCFPCHGAAGLGDGPMTKRGVPPPPSLLATHALEMPDGQMFHVITLGQANMASYASQLQPEDRWKVIRFIRTIQEAAR